MTTRDSHEALMALLKLTDELTDDQPLDVFLGAVTQTANRLVASQHASIRLVDKHDASLVSTARTGIGSAITPPAFRRGEGLIGWVAEHKLPIRLADAHHDPRYKKVAGQGYEFTSIIAEPLWAGNEVIGVLSVNSKLPNAFSADDQLLVRLLANCSVPAIERARLRDLAMFDYLTQAFNHRYLYPRISEEMERSSRMRQPMSLLLMDLDHFKNVNDTYGHAAGDTVIRLFAERVRAKVRRVDVLVRRGGEEFVLIMPGTDEAQASATAARICDHLGSQPVALGNGTRIKQTVSVGVATWDGQESAEALEARTDEAMYEAKRSGRDRVHMSVPPPPDPHG
jgi:two-component system, cell cycle response regulator